MMKPPRFIFELGGFCMGKETELHNNDANSEK